MLLSISELLLLIIALSADAFAASFAYGTDKVKIPAASAMTIALISDSILIVSLLVGGAIQTYIPPGVTTWLSFLILLILGLLKLFDSSVKQWIRHDRPREKELHVTFKNLRLILTIYALPEKANTEDIEVLSPAEAVSLGLALSLDSAAAGIGAASSQFPVLLTAALAFIIGIAAVYSGCALGRIISTKTKFNFSMIGGVLLLFLAFAKLC